MDNVIEEKSFRFAVHIVKLNQYLRTKKKEYVLSKQMLRSGTSIGANITEAQQAQSRADFVSKMEIAMKETGILSIPEFESIFPDCIELEKLLVRIIKTTKN